MTTLTHIATPKDQDYRTDWFQAKLEHNLSSSDISQKYNFTKFDRDDDLELRINTLLIDYEESREIENYACVSIGLVTENQVFWLEPNLAMKKLIKLEGHQDLMVGSGKICACIRIAIYLRRQENILNSFLKLEALAT